jgi:hypothetical protein
VSGSVGELVSQIVELVGVDDRVDLLDLPGATVDGQQLVVATESEQRGSPAVDLERLNLSDREVSA